jgi:hypothetical protein
MVGVTTFPPAWFPLYSNNTARSIPAEANPNQIMTTATQSNGDRVCSSIYNSSKGGCSPGRSILDPPDASSLEILSPSRSSKPTFQRVNFPHHASILSNSTSRTRYNLHVVYKPKRGGAEAASQHSLATLAEFRKGVGRRRRGRSSSTGANIALISATSL